MKSEDRPLTAKPKRPCACSGVRWCADCRDPETRRLHGLRTPLPLPPLLAGGDYTPDGEGVHAFDVAIQRAPTLPDFEGVRLLEDFVSEDEAEALLAGFERTPFLPSQSGREKLHFGPRVNFNRGRVDPERLHGLPAWAPPLETRLRERVAAAFPADDPVHDALARYVTTDVFVLRYAPERASNLDFHLDDLFAYGELILDLSLASDTTLTLYRGRPDGEVDDPDDVVPACVRVPLPARSLALLFGPARFAWEHALLAPDLPAPRTSITFRTVSEALAALPEGREVLERAKRILPAS
ncbi:MAG: alpha-ketoglutarate-dependent dioxygenase AlkB [bacterium]|nr:alpha-ketoglutarate-dependent dioxygenase AlkB [bacterium]